ncbi:MAG: ATP-binding cassette domain-containing protein [Cyanobacteriota bacterium]|nr:ATP-binding cassette domain-containing protein [Cyanobacteriota bacterium]
MVSINPIVAFELEGVSLQFGQYCALGNIDLTIYEGERVALVGSSGAGKSTLLSLLNGTRSPTLGTVRILGRNLIQLTPRQQRVVRRQVGTIYQQFHLVDRMRAIHNVNAGHLGRWSLLKAIVSLFWPLEIDTAARALTRVGIPDKLYERTSQLSGGQQQRVAIARVLVQNPAAILADEPISSLDPQNSREVLDLLVDLSRQTGKTLVVSLHEIEFARSHCDRAIGLSDGRILFDLPTRDLSAAQLEELYRRRD